MPWSSSKLPPWMRGLHEKAQQGGGVYTEWTALFTDAQFLRWAFCFMSLFIRFYFLECTLPTISHFQFSPIVGFTSNIVWSSLHSLPYAHFCFTYSKKSPKFLWHIYFPPLMLHLSESEVAPYREHMEIGISGRPSVWVEKEYNCGKFRADFWAIICPESPSLLQHLSRIANVSTVCLLHS